MVVIAAHGGQFDENLRPVATSPQAVNGVTEPVCAPLWPGAVLLCFRIWEDGARRWVTRADAERWNVGSGQLTTSVRANAAAHVARAELMPVEGTDAFYLRLVDGDWAAAGVLAPDAVAARLGGGPVRMAVPAEGVFVAWKAGDADLDKIMAVGVRELFDQTPGPVSPRVFLWDGVRWTPFGQANPR